MILEKRTVRRVTFALDRCGSSGASWIFVCFAVLFFVCVRAAAGLVKLNPIPALFLNADWADQADKSGCEKITSLESWLS